jgi:hypothetical protein
VQTVRRQQDEHDEVGDQQRHIKRIGVIQTPECGVEKMLANVLADAPRGYESGWKRRGNGGNAQGKSLSGHYFFGEPKTVIVLEGPGRLGESRTT